MDTNTDEESIGITNEFDNTTIAPSTIHIIEEEQTQEKQQHQQQNNQLEKGIARERIQEQAQKEQI